MPINPHTKKITNRLSYSNGFFGVGVNTISRRSLLHFAVLIIYAIGMTLFLLQKADEAIKEIDALQIGNYSY